MEKDKEKAEWRRIRSCSKTHHSSVYTLFLLLIAEIYSNAVMDHTFRNIIWMPSCGASLLLPPTPLPAMLVICLEGCHGCGKTELCQHFEAAGFQVLDEAFIDMKEVRTDAPTTYYKNTRPLPSMARDPLTWRPTTRNRCTRKRSSWRRRGYRPGSSGSCSCTTPPTRRPRRRWSTSATGRRIAR